MKFLCLAYGDEAAWNALTKEEQGELLRQDEVLRRRGAIVSPLGPATTVRSPDGFVAVEGRSFAIAPLPLVGFGLFDARDLDEAISLVKDTPCARAGGAVELWPLTGEV